MPAESVHLPPNGRARLIVVANVTSDPSLSVKLRKFDATLTIRLREFVRPSQVQLGPRTKKFKARCMTRWRRPGFWIERHGAA